MNLTFIVNPLILRTSSGESEENTAAPIDSYLQANKRSSQNIINAYIFCKKKSVSQGAWGAENMINA